MKLSWMSLVLMAVSAPCSVRAQQVAFAANAGGELDSATQAMLTRDFARARERGLPVEPLAAKVREGRLKNATGPRIRTAVVSLSARLDSARAALGTSASPEELIAGADALLAGAPISALRTLRTASARSLAAPLGTLAQLVLSGVQSRRAVEMIVALLQKNAAPAQILALGSLVESDVLSGLRADESAAFRLRSIEGAVMLGESLTNAVAPGNGQQQDPTRPSKPVRKP